MTSYMSKDQDNFGLSVHDPFKSSLCVSVSSRELHCSIWPGGRCIQYGLNWSALRRDQAVRPERVELKRPMWFLWAKPPTTSMRYLPARICPVGVQTSHLGVLSAGNCGVKTFDHLSAHQPAGWFWCWAPSILCIGCWKMRDCRTTSTCWCRCVMLLIVPQWLTDLTV